LLPFLCQADDAPATDAGEALYESMCSACHGPENVMVSTPKGGGLAEWGRRAARGAKGLETLTDNAVNGLAATLLKGGRSELSRDQIRQAIAFKTTRRN